MDKYVEKIIVQKVSKSFDCLNKSIQAFKRLLKEDAYSGSSEYYRARSYLRDGEIFFKEALKEAKKFLGPIPEYASQDFEKWRFDMLEKSRVLAKTQNLELLQSELSEDKFLNEWMDKKEIGNLLEKDFQAQQTGKRKLSNIKVRIAIEKLKELISQAKELKKNAMEKQQMNV